MGGGRQSVSCTCLNTMKATRQENKMRAPFLSRLMREGSCLAIRTQNTLDMLARLQSNPNQIVRTVIFTSQSTRAPHQTAHVLLRCRARLIQSTLPRPPPDPPRATPASRFPLHWTYRYRSFPSARGVGLHSLTRAEPTTASVLSSSDTAHCVRSSPCYTACSSELIHVSDRDKVNVELLPDEIPKGVSQSCQCVDLYTVRYLVCACLHSDLIGRRW